MVTKSEAEALVQKWLDEHKIESWHQGKLLEINELGISAVQEYPWGWMFFYDTKRRISGDFRYALGGNAPVYVTREDGQFHEAVTGTAVPVEQHLRLFEARLNKKP